jgi:hypothetical protein
MGLFSKNDDGSTKATVNRVVDNSKFKDVKLKSAGDVLVDIFKATSGSSVTKKSDYDIFYNVIAFKGVKAGVGVSTLVANTAVALAKYGLTVCVIDTSILNPSQDVLLKTNYKEVKEDWFDMPFTRNSVMNVSSITSRVTVLSFKNRNILDITSLNDNATLVDIAMEKIEGKFDIILMDICEETSAVGNACMLRAQQIYQVWSNAPQELAAIQGFVTNQLTCCIPLEKMRYVITSSAVDDINTDWTTLINKYKFTHLAHVGKSLDIARLCARNKIVYDYVMDSEDIDEFNDCINDICAKILGIKLDKKGNVVPKHKGNITVSDVAEGNVDGTLTKKMKKKKVEQEEFEDSLIAEDTAKALAGMKAAAKANKKDGEE